MFRPKASRVVPGSSTPSPASSPAQSPPQRFGTPADFIKEVDEEFQLLGVPNVEPGERPCCPSRYHRPSCADPTASLTYVLLAFVFCVTFFLCLLTWIDVVEWNVDDGYISMLPVISAGLADSAAIQAVFLVGVSLQLLIYVIFWVLWDDTLDRVNKIIEVGDGIFRSRATRKLKVGKPGKPVPYPWTRKVIAGIWWSRVFFLALRQLALVFVASFSMRTFSTVHGLSFLAAITAHIIYEILSIFQRGWYVVFRPCAVHVAMIFIEFALLPAQVACLVCFRSDQCLGGANAQPAYEQALCIIIPVTIAFLALDVGV